VAAADPHRMADLYRAAANEHAQRLAEYRSQLPELTDDGATHPQHPRLGNYATLRYGVAIEEMRAEWCRWMAATLTAGSPHRSTSGQATGAFDCGAAVEDSATDNDRQHL
jgi:hypothetical protein